MGFGPQDWDLGLEAGIWASRLRYGPGGWGEGGVEEEEEKKEKTPHMCESIGHRPLPGCCPKAGYAKSTQINGKEQQSSTAKNRIAISIPIW